MQSSRDTEKHYRRGSAEKRLRRNKRRDRHRKEMNEEA